MLSPESLEVKITKTMKKETKHIMIRQEPNRKQRHAAVNKHQNGKEKTNQRKQTNQKFPK
jgi:hypothetical protein